MEEKHTTDPPKFEEITTIVLNGKINRDFDEQYLKNKAIFNLVEKCNTHLAASALSKYSFEHLTTEYKVDKLSDYAVFNFLVKWFE